MPSGSYVRVRISNRNVKYMSIYVYPLRTDSTHTTGLCGNYNGNADDDVPLPGQQCTTECEKHR